MTNDPSASTDESPISDETGNGSYSTAPTQTTGMPAGIPFIIGNEAAERFSFYGMKSILTIFMVDYLQWMGNSQSADVMSNAEATEHFHTFTAAAYAFPVLGALLSDVFIGKYRTILWLSIVYCIGHAALAMMGAPPMGASMWLFVGLALIALGSGGIKPCVSAHVGDQFGKANKHLLTTVYQWFYFSINFGSFISTLLTPWLLQHYGPHWAFGVPGVLMALATFLFWLGRHRFVHIPPGGMAFLKETFSWTGLSALVKLMIIFSFVAVFWALFDQTGSSWVLQAKSLNRTVLGFNVLESQIQAVNPILVLALIPVFQFFIYPALDRVFPLTPIRKISIGLFVMAAGFAVVSLVQERVDAGQEPSISWQFLAYAVLTASEVMVSITCLEFAYTQAPKTMKSAVMAVFLFSVSLGNLFTAAVNNYIQTPSAASAVSEHGGNPPDAGSPIDQGKFSGTYLSATEARLDGFDGKPRTEDDVVLMLSDEGGVQEVATSSRDAFDRAAQKIEDSFFASGEEATLPDNGQAAELIAGENDAYGNPIRYQLISRDRFQLVSEGSDKIDGTQWDESQLVIVSRASQSDDKNDAPLSWLERRQIELEGGDDPDAKEKEILASRNGGSETTFEREFSVGGRTLLEGAAYFWFWTKCIFVTAVLFVPVGYFYREKTYIQDEDDGDETVDAVS